MREIPLGRSGRVALIDDEDFGRVSSAGRWQFNMLGRNSHGVAYCYAQRKVPNGKGGSRTVMLHRFILDAPSGMMVDHLNHDGLDNRRCNLRLATRSENLANHRKGRGTSSRFLGVYWHKLGRKWAAGCSGAHLGMFANEVDAALAYDRAASRAFGAFASLNFPAAVSAA